MPVTLGGYLVLLGITYITAAARPSRTTDYTVGLRLDQPDSAASSRSAAWSRSGSSSRPAVVLASSASAATSAPSAVSTARAFRRPAPRIAVARAIAGPSAVILADEPTGNLDSESGSRVLSLFRDLTRSEGRALLIVTHDPLVHSIADRIVRIRDGMLAPSED